MKIIDLSQPSTPSTNGLGDFAEEVLNGLRGTPKHISAKYFYDDRGSELFQKITHEPDYYLTKKEFAILESIAGDIPHMVARGRKIDLVELGAGDGHKTRLLIDGFLRAGIEVDYYPIDISERAMRLMEGYIKPVPGLRVTGIVADYMSGLSHLSNVSRNPKVAIFLGSNIGNFDRAQSIDMLRRTWQSLGDDDHLLVGFDQKKDIEVLNRAYNDSSGYTTEFNLNLLSRVNRELGGKFRLENFQHYGFYNPLKGAMESYLISKLEHEVEISALGRSFKFRKHEPIHLEYSFKFSRLEIESLSKETGFEVVRHFSDSEGYFIDSLWRVKKPGSIPLRS